NVQHFMPPNSWKEKEQFEQQRRQLKQKVKWMMTNGQEKCKFSSVPGQLQFSLRDIMDENQEILSCVILGFTKDGNYLSMFCFVFFVLFWSSKTMLSDLMTNQCTTIVSYSNSQNAGEEEGRYHMQWWKFDFARKLKLACSLSILNHHDPNRDPDAYY